MRTQPNNERIGYILINVLQGKSLTDVSKELHISRERVRQIYTKHGTVSYKNLQKEIKKVKVLEKRKLLRKKILFNCVICNIPVHAMEGNKVIRKKTICETCKKRELAPLTYLCDWCNKPYHPYRTTLYQSMLMHFCREEHYFNFLKAYKKSIFRLRLREKTNQLRYWKNRAGELERRIRQIKAHD